MPYFSIIMPVFDGENYVRKAIASVRNQSFSDFELIIIDDGSKDNSLEICLAECQKDPRIKFIAQNNKGALLARKTGVQTADGIYTLFLIKIFADYFFYTFQKRLSFREFWKLGEQISIKKYMHNYTSDLKLGPIWRPIYILMKLHKYKCLYFYFLLLQLGYFTKHGKFST